MSISNTDNILDSRDIEARIDELETDRDIAQEDGEDLDEDDAAELAALVSLREDCGSSEWRNGLTLIADYYFEDYAEQLAEDIGALDRGLSWPCNHIDWKAAAEELQHDYSCVDFGGEMYWCRN